MVGKGPIFESGLATTDHPEEIKYAMLGKKEVIESGYMPLPRRPSDNSDKGQSQFLRISAQGGLVNKLASPRFEEPRISTQGPSLGVSAIAGLPPVKPQRIDSNARATMMPGGGLKKDAIFEEYCILLENYNKLSMDNKKTKI
jgi:hypothetical protein